MEVKEALKKLGSDKEFKRWHKNNPESFLSHVFFMLGQGQEDIQIGYHNPISDLVTTFEIKDPIVINPAEKVFKKPGDKVKSVDMKSVKITLSQAIEQADLLHKEKYSSEIALKKIIILQTLDEYGMIFNITYMTHSFKTLNIKINAENGDIIHHHLVSIMEFPQKK